jgi:YidC/Oxa1 family membrane protein insertase
MSTTRSFLLVALAFVAFLNWEAWQKDYAPQPAPAATSATPTAPAATSSAEIPKPAGANAPAAATTSPTPTAATNAQPSARVHVRTDLLDLSIDTRGGSLVQADLLQYPVDP